MAPREAASKRRLLAILVADVVGYSGLMARSEADTFHRLQDLQTNLIHPAVERNNGRLVKYVGDGFIADFDSAVDALRAAVEIQSGARSSNQGFEEDKQIRFRMGINSGDVIVVPGDVYGDTFNVAARLQTLAKPGGICISRAVRDTVRGKFDVGFDDVGEVPVKNIPDPVGTFEVRFDPIAWTMPDKPARPARTLPLKTLAACAALVLAIGGGAVLFASWRSGSPQAALLASLKRALPEFSDESRAKLAERFAKESEHKVLAVAIGAARYWVARRTTLERAATGALENCQILSRKPCSIVARDEALDIDFIGGTWRSNDMPRVRYEGLFSPVQIPGVFEEVRNRPDVQGYAKAPEPKAVAFQVMHARLFVAVGGPDQRSTEAKALADCNEAGSRMGDETPCVLYAVGNQVVLPKRTPFPITKAP